jgi:hypothetical protein
MSCSNEGYAVQLDLFESFPPLSSASPASPIVGLRVEMPQACASCGCNIGVIGSSACPHANRIDCVECSAFCRWLKHREAAFIAEVATKFGCPLSPIILRTKEDV